MGNLWSVIAQVCNLKPTANQDPSSLNDPFNESGESENQDFNQPIAPISDRSIFSVNKPKNALMIGINYDKDESESNDLRGCENDILRLSKLLISKFDFKSEDLEILNTKNATKRNIQMALKNMVTFAYNNRGAELFFHFSGHGTQQASLYESDAKGESICPVDYMNNGLISDVWLKKEFIDELPRDCKIFCLVDCCHSGTNMNLCYNYDFVSEKLCRDADNALTTKATVVKISGCLDEQVSYDYFDNRLGIFNGALTNAFIETCSRKDDIVAHTSKIHDYLTSQGFPQKPNLTMSGKYDKIKL